MGTAELALSPYSVLCSWANMGLEKFLKVSAPKCAIETVGGYHCQNLFCSLLMGIKEVTSSIPIVSVVRTIIIIIIKDQKQVRADIESMLQVTVNLSITKGSHGKA